ncbi:MAG: class I adenylate-forming enzyme family protein [Actinomycetota bacterium]
MIGELLRRVASEEPEAVAFVHGDRRLTYAAWDLAADRAAARLWEAGVRPGDVVALLMEPSFWYPIAYVGVARLGCVTAGINPRFGPREIEHILSSSDARVLVSDLEAPGSTPRLSPMSLGDADPEPPDAEAAPADPVAIVYTSGTTGLPKGATFTVSALDAVRRIESALEPSLELTSGLQATPMTHMGYMTKIASHIERRAKTVLMSDRWTARSALELIAQERITHIGGVPTQLALMMMDPEFGRFDLSCIQSILIGGAPASPDLVRQIRETFGVPVQVRFSSTELALCTATRPGDADATVAETVGSPLPEVELRVLAPNKDGIGEVVARSPAMMRGYWNDVDATREAIDADGFFHPGDLGRIDEDGNLRLAGRTKEMYIRGGYNVYPLEVENVLREHPKVALVGVIGIPDDVLGERGKAFVVAADPSDPPTDDELKSFVAERIADYKVPDVVELRSELPLTSMFKVDKAALSSLP